MGTIGELFSSWDNVSDDDIKSGGFPKVPDGKHVAVVKDVSVEDAPSGDGQVIRTDLYFPSANISMQDRFYPSSKDGSVKIMKGRLKSLGLKAENSQQLKAALKSTVGWTVNVTVKTNGKYQNIYFDGVVDKASKATKDDIPF